MAQKDRDWIRDALDRYEKPLVRYAARFTGDWESARDVVQDTFLKLCNVDQGRVQHRLAAWLYTVCRNRAIDVRRKEGRMSPLDMKQAEAQKAPGPLPSVSAERAEARDQVLGVVDTLPKEQQEAFRLKFEDDLTYREISQIMGVSLGKVSNLVAAALDVVRGKLSGVLEATGEVHS
ncbi:MAG: sigma-70 family RNA polymerase sigma factor [bacterium]|nr:sigma-70 family RNA polymerase sigma factor [bacterium]